MKTMMAQIYCKPLIYSNFATKEVRNEGWSEEVYIHIAEKNLHFETAMEPDTPIREALQTAHKFAKKKFKEMGTVKCRRKETAKMSNFKDVKQFMKDFGITDIVAYVKSLRDFEAYVREADNSLFNQAWDYVNKLEGAGFECDLCDCDLDGVTFYKYPRGGGCYDRVCQDCYDDHGGDPGMIEEAISERQNDE